MHVYATLPFACLLLVGCASAQGGRPWYQPQTVAVGITAPGLIEPAKGLSCGIFGTVFTVTWPWGGTPTTPQPPAPASPAKKATPP